MSSYENIKVVNMIAGEDLRSDLHELLRIEDDGGVAKVVKTAAATDVGVGILAENPNSGFSTDGYTVPVVLVAGGGKAMVKAGATITAGDLIVPDTTAGRVTSVADIASLAADQMAIGVALETAADGEVFEILLQVIAAPHSA